MKQLLPFFFVLGCLIPPAPAQTIYTVDNLPNTHLQAKTRYVSDPAAILSTATRDSIDAMLYALDRQTGIEVAVATLPSIGQADCFTFAYDLFTKWGVGKKGNDNGLVVLLVTDQRCIQFVTGYGLEGDLPDAICKRIQARQMNPKLAKGDWDGGMVAGIRAVCARLDGSMSGEAPDEGEEPFIPFITLLVVAGALFAVAFGAARRRSRCPACKKHKLQRTGVRLLSNHNGVRTEEVTYTCRNCGHTLMRLEQRGSNNYRGGSGGGPVIFGGGFGGFGGGGGGSFGGGRSGGGGAGSRF
ncbi:MAG: TPM domain-containing protein [Prevotellaceae bacterium]|jgi:uncharacterized protein|nr:TPM domain-containing protein [Prevotellaceae bacterium]